MRSNETPPPDARATRLANVNEQFDNARRRTDSVESPPDSGSRDAIDQPCSLAPESLRRIRRRKPPQSRA